MTSTPALSVPVCASANTSPTNQAGSPRLSPEEVAEGRIYAAMTGVVIAGTEEFIEPFQLSPGSTHRLRAVTREESFPRFFHLADKMTQEICRRLAEIIRADSIQTVVRESPAPALARRIREVAFTPLDRVLCSYLHTVNNLLITYRNIKLIQRRLEEQTLPDPSSQPHPVPNSLEAGQRPDSHEADDRTLMPDEAEGTVKDREAGHSETAVDAAETTLENWATEEELVRQHTNLHETQTRAFSQIINYLNTLSDMPALALAYASSKCFGGEVDYALEREQVAAIQGEIQAKLRQARGFFLEASAVARREVEDEMRSILMNIEMNKMLTRMLAEKAEAEQRKEARRMRLRHYLKIILFSLSLAMLTIALSLGIIMAMKSKPRNSQPVPSLPSSQEPKSLR